jgi:uncharacterized Tic20 family protein
MTDQTALSTSTTGLERVLAGAAHGSVLLGVPFLVPILTLIFASLIQPSAYVKNQSLQAIAFHFVVAFIFGALLAIAAAFGLFAFIGGAFSAVMANPGSPDLSGLVLPANLGIALLVLCVGFLFLAWASIIALVATVRGFQGRYYRYPIVGGLFN